MTRPRPSSSQAPRGFRADLIDGVRPNLQSLLGPLEAAGRQHGEAKAYLTRVVSREKMAARAAEAGDKAAEAAKARIANAATGKGKKRARGAGS